MEETVKGFKDLLGEEAKKRKKIRDITTNVFELYGFEPAETPIIEYEEFVKQENSQDEAVSDIFRLKDKGERNLALRYEFTFQLKRIAKNKKLPYKRYQIGEVFRDEPTSSLRFRQFTQCDIDTIGSNIKDEAEILKVISVLFQKLNIDIEIQINNRKLLNEILDSEKIKEKAQVLREIDKLDKLPESEVKENLKRYKAEKILPLFKKPESFFKKFASFKEIQELENYCKMYNLEITFKPNLARGLSYYNSSVFEIKTKSMKESIAGGGSYFVNEIQGTGISFSLERISQLAQINLEEKEVLIISIGQEKESIKLAEKLRENNISTTIWLEKGISKALDCANSQKIPYVIFIGEEEIKKKKFKLRDMKTGKEEMLEEKEIIKILD